MKQMLLLILMTVAFLAPKTSFAAPDEQNKKTLKEAVVGAVTGAVAVEATKEDDVPASASSEDSGGKAHKNFSTRKRHPHRHDDGDRPYGWSQGKKTGWGGKDLPPGLAKNEP